MKKLLAMLGAAGLVVSTSAVLVSCGSDKDTVDDSIVNVELTLGSDKLTETVAITINEGDVVTVTEIAKSGEIATAIFKLKDDSKTEGNVVITAVKAGEVSFEVKTTPKVEETTFADEENETPAPVEPTLIKTINVKVNPEATDEADLTALTAKMDEAKALDSAKYTPDSFAKVTSALEAAEKITVKNTQEEVDAATSALTKAITELVEAEEPTKDSDLTALTAKMDEAKALDSAKYTPDSFAKVTSALEAAEKITVKNTQEEVDAATSALTKAITELVEAEEPTKDSDLTALTAKMDEAKALDSAKYTPDSFAKVTSALEAAEKITVKNTQEEVDAATSALTKAITELVDADDNEGGTPEEFSFYYQA